MQYHFDEIIDRKGTSCVKHDLMEPHFGNNDLLPMWVADMDFRTPDFIMDAIRKRCEHEVLGYTFGSESYFQSIITWLKKHYHITAHREELHFIPGIVSGIAFCIQAFTQKGDKILITPPVYPPFIDLPQNNDRELVSSPLQIINGRFSIDFDDLAIKSKDCKLMILSNPHNPGGTVWSKNDLLQIADICYQNGMILISDEIHADLTLPGYRHTSFSTISEQARNISITFIAPSKTFNIAGLGSSVCYIRNSKLKNTFYGFLEHYETANGNVFAYVGAEAAFKFGEDWLRQVKEYIYENVLFLDQYLKESLPAVKAVLPEASYLVWLDFNALPLTHEALKTMLIDKAKVALNDGTNFGGEQYRGYFRINIGCPRATLKMALDAIAKAIENMKL